MVVKFSYRFFFSSKFVSIAWVWFITSLFRPSLYSMKGSSRFICFQVFKIIQLGFRKKKKSETNGIFLVFQKIKIVIQLLLGEKVKINCVWFVNINLRSVLNFETLLQELAHDCNCILFIVIRKPETKDSLDWVNWNAWHVDEVWNLNTLVGDRILFR